MVDLFSAFAFSSKIFFFLFIFLYSVPGKMEQSNKSDISLAFWHGCKINIVLYWNWNWSAPCLTFIQFLIFAMHFKQSRINFNWIVVCWYIQYRASFGFFLLFSSIRKLDIEVDYCCILRTMGSLTWVNVFILISLIVHLESWISENEASSSLLLKKRIKLFRTSNTVMCALFLLVYLSDKLIVYENW